MLKALLKKWGAKNDPQNPPLLGSATIGQAGENQALDYLLGQGLKLVQRNYRVAAGPSRRAGEVDLILRDADGSLVFVEVRIRSGHDHGGAAGSIDRAKRKRIVYAAQHYMRAMPSPPPCRFDVVAIDGGQLQWLRAAFDAGNST
ncbi:MAG: YraN family protein [Burkholderiales bacterium]